jgi:hypothetical protein
VTFFTAPSQTVLYLAFPHHLEAVPAVGLHLSSTFSSIFFSHHGHGNRRLRLNELIKTLDPQFVGDIHQPLHDENLEYGGNDIDVTFDGTSTNLHHIVRTLPLSLQCK